MNDYEEIGLVIVAVVLALMLAGAVWLVSHPAAVHAPGTPCGRSGAVCFHGDHG